MKTMRYMIAAMTLGAALFTGCNKENSLENGLGATANETANGTTNVTFQLQTLLPPAGALIKWNSGSIMAIEDIFNGSHLAGNMVQKNSFPGKAAGTYDLFNSPVLGTVYNVPYSAYLGVSTEILLNPLNSNYSLSLNGTFSTTPANNGIPVQVIINQPIELQSVWLSNIKISVPAYLAIMSLDMNQVTNGITAGMLEKAQQINGTILITSKFNPNLYSLIINNFENASMNLQLSAETQPTPVPAPVSAQTTAINPS